MTIKKTKAVFVTGVGTGVGKSVICGMLGRFLLERKYKVITQKWVQTGAIEFGLDIAVHLKLMKKKEKEFAEFLADMVPYSFKFPASPHLASELERTSINKNKIKKSFKVLNDNFEFVIVESAGGALVPYNRKEVLIDIAAELNLPVLIVVKNELGAINHTLLTIEAIRSRGFKICGIIFNNAVSGENEIILQDNIKIIKKLSKEKVLGTLSFSKSRANLYEEFISIGKKFLKEV